MVYSVEDDHWSVWFLIEVLYLCSIRSLRNFQVINEKYNFKLVLLAAFWDQWQNCYYIIATRHRTEVFSKGLILLVLGFSVFHCWLADIPRNYSDAHRIWVFVFKVAKFICYMFPEIADYIDVRELSFPFSKMKQLYNDWHVNSSEVKLSQWLTIIVGWRKVNRSLPRAHQVQHLYENIIPEDFYSDHFA